MATKQFKIAAKDIRSLAVGYGGCIASDKITVDGERVCYMVRSEPSRREDSGWLFTSGTESQDYMDDAANFAVYDVNTIANYDPDIIPLLKTPPGSSFERRRNEGALVRCDGPDPSDAPGDDSGFGDAPGWPPPGFPLVDGNYALSPSWQLTLPTQFARRLENGALVLWRPGITIWLTSFRNDARESQAARLADLKAVMSPDATDVHETCAQSLTRLTYRVREDEVASVMALVVSDTGHLQASIYFDHEGDAAVATKIANSIVPVGFAAH